MLQGYVGVLLDQVLEDGGHVIVFILLICS